jgi:hypothetical protein
MRIYPLLYAIYLDEKVHEMEEEAEKVLNHCQDSTHSQDEELSYN